MTIIPGVTPCLRCIFDEMPDAGSSPTCDTAGVIMPIIATVSAVQVTEALKILVGDMTSLHRSLMQFDVWANDRQRIKLGEPNADCKTCGRREFEYLDAENVEFNAVLCGRNAVQIGPPAPVTLDLEQLADRLRSSTDVKLNEYLLRFNSAEYELTVFRDGRAIIRGTDDVAIARSLYSRFVGS
jgi:adenylyltransferase/sulfurtransferase